MILTIPLSPRKSPTGLALPPSQVFLPENSAEGHYVFASLSSTEGTFSILVGDRESFIYSTYSRVITGLFKKY